MRLRLVPLGLPRRGDDCAANFLVEDIPIPRAAGEVFELEDQFARFVQLHSGRESAGRDGRGWRVVGAAVPCCAGVGAARDAGRHRLNRRRDAAKRPRP